MSMQGVAYLWRKDIAMMLAMVLAGGVGDVRAGRPSEIEVSLQNDESQFRHKPKVHLHVTGTY